jgi:hypothetical protein
MILNGIEITTIEELELAIVDLDELNKQFLRNEFNGVPNLPVLTEFQVMIASETDFYINKRKNDGEKAFFELMAELRLHSLQNSLPRAVNKYIERKLKTVRDEVCLGQWISAREYLDEVVVEGFLTQELYDRVKNKLDTYIAENY